MPIKKCQSDNKPGYKWGDAGKCYIYDPKSEASKKSAKEKAIAQGVAIGDLKSNPISEFKSMFGPKVGFDWDDTLSTSAGQSMYNTLKRYGKDIYIVSATQNPTPLKMYASRVGIPDDHIFIVKSNQQKINKVKELGLDQFYDNNPDVVNALPSVGVLFK